MNEIPLKYQEKVDTYQPIDFEGIMLYPIKVREYALFQTARPAIEILQQSFPVRYVSMPLLSAMHAMEVENLQEGKESTGLLFRALLFLVLSLGLHRELTAEERVQELVDGIVVSAENHSVLKEIRFMQDGEVKSITPVIFQRMRPVLAAQNGIKLESSDVNPELAEAERDLAEQNGPKLDTSIASLITSLSALTGKEESEIYGWPILKMSRRRESFERIFAYLVCGFATASGSKFKGGNPVPSPFFERLDGDSGSLIDMYEFTKGHQVSVSATAPTQGFTP